LTKTTCLIDTTEIKEITVEKENTTKTADPLVIEKEGPHITP
jgi:hypothetical protein